MLADSFDDPSAGVLSQALPGAINPSTGVADQERVYVDGEYSVRNLDATGTSFVFRGFGVPGVFADASLMFDVRFVGDTNMRYVAVECRKQPAPPGSPPSSYRLHVTPSTGRLK